MNVPPPFRRFVPGAGLALAALAPAVLSGPAQAATASPGLSPFQIRAAGTAVVFTL